MTGKISEDPDRVVDGTEKFAAAVGGSNFGILTSSIATYLASLAQALTNKTINAASNTISNLTTAMFAANVVDIDGTFAANSDTRIPSQKAVKTATDALSSSLSGKIDTSAIDIDPTFTANSDSKIPSQKAVKTALDALVIAGGGVAGPGSSTDSGFVRWDGTSGGLLKDGAATVALGSEVSGTLPVANGGTGYTGVAFTADSGAVLKNQAGTSFGAGSYTYTYLIIGKLVILSGRATITTLSPCVAGDQVAIPLPVNSKSNGSFSARNTAFGRIADGRTISTNANALVYDSVGLANGTYFDFTIIYESV